MADKIIHIMLAFARDSVPLSEIAKHEIKLLNNTFSSIFPISLETHDWVQNGVSGMGNPEKQVLSTIPLENCDIFVGIFRFDYGNPTGNINPGTGQPYKSGMEEEFDVAYRYWKNAKKPDIIILKSEEAIPRENIRSNCNIDDLENFFNEFRHDGHHPGLYNTFSNEVEFGEQLRRNMMSRIIDTLRNTKDLIRLGVEDYYNHLGILDFFVENNNHSRNERKVEQIKNTRKLRLHARTCYSYICKLGFFYPEIGRALEAGMEFRVIMQNPWSLNAIHAARDEDQFRKCFNQYQNNKISADELLAAFESSLWYRTKYLECIVGFNELHNKYGKKISLKISDMDLSNSILLSDKEVFFEPYLNGFSLGSKVIPLFEIRATRSAELYQDAERDFDDIWKTSCGIVKFTKNKAEYRKRLLEYLKREVRR